MDKARIINRLAAVHGYRQYLELCAATTGGQYDEVDRRRLSCRRLSYVTPDEHPTRRNPLMLLTTGSVDEREYKYDWRSREIYAH